MGRGRTIFAVALGALLVLATVMATPAFGSLDLLSLIGLGAQGQNDPLGVMADASPVYPVTGDEAKTRVQVTFESDGVVNGTSIVHAGDTLEAPDAPAAAQSAKVFDHWDIGGANLSAYLGRTLSAEDISALAGGSTADAEHLHRVAANAVFVDGHSVRFHQFTRQECLADTSLGTVMSYVSLAASSIDLSVASRVFVPIVEGSDARLVGWEAYAAPASETPSSRYASDETVGGLSDDLELYPVLSKGFNVTFDVGEDAPLIEDLFVRDEGSGSGTLLFSALPTEESLAGDSYNADTHEYDPAYRGWKQGWILEGWYSDDALEHKIVSDVTIADDTVVHARWLPRADSTYNIVNMIEGAEGGPGQGSFTMLSAIERRGVTGELTSSAEVAKPLDFYHRATAEELADRPELTGWEDQTILGNGMTAVNVYWFRDRYNLKLLSQAGATLFGPKLVKYGERIESYDPSGSVNNILYWNLETKEYAEGRTITSPYTRWHSPSSIPGIISVSDGGDAVMNVNVGTCSYSTVSSWYDDLLDGEEPSSEAVTLNLAKGNITFEHESTVTSMRANTGSTGYYKAFGTGGKYADYAITNGSSTIQDRSTKTADWEEATIGYTKPGDPYTLYFDVYRVRNRYHLGFGNCSGTSIDAEHLAGYDIQYGQHLRRYTPAFDASTKRVQGGVTYRFKGWYSDAFAASNWQLPSSEAFVVDVGSATMIGTDYTLYAAWEPEAYDVTFNANGGVFEPVEGATLSPDGGLLTFSNVASGSLLTKPATPTRVENGLEYTFVGWFRDAGLTDPWNFSSSTVQGETTLYAKWVRGRRCHVTYHAADGSTIAGLDDLSYSYGARVTAASQPDDPSQTKSFMGWSTVRDNTAYLVGQSFTITSNMDLFALYGDALPGARPEDVTPGAPVLTLASNYPAGAGGEEVTATLQATRENATVTLPSGLAGASATGYHVVSWSEGRDGSGATFLVGDPVAVASSGTLYAQWEKNQLSATVQDSFVYDGSEHEPKPSVVGWDGSSLVLGTDYELSWTNQVDAHAAAGEGAPMVTVKGLGDYALADSVALPFEIAPKPVTIVLSDRASRVGEVVATLAYEVTPPLVNPSHLGDIVPYTAVGGARTPVDKTTTGSYQILVDYDDNPNYEVSVTPGTYTVSAASLLVTAQGFTGTYDGQPHSATVSLLPDSAVESGAKVYYALSPLTADNYEEDGKPDAPPIVDAGTTTVYYYVVGTDSYEPDAGDVTGSRNVVINPAPLVVTASGAQVRYGDDARNEGVTFAGFVADDDEGDLGSFSPNYEYNSKADGTGDAYVPGSPAGTYYIRPTGAAWAGNYALSYRTGTLSVGRRVAQIAWSSDDQLPFTGTTRTYAGASVTNCLGDDVVSVDARGTTALHAGDYTATATGLSGVAAPNYELPGEGTSHEWHITRAANSATVSVEDWIYGAVHALPTVTAGFGDQTAQFEYATSEEGPFSAAQPVAAGDYWARASIAQTDDYDAATSPAVSFTVSRRRVSVSGLGAQDKDYDASVAATASGDPVLGAVPGVSESGLVAGDDVAVSPGRALFSSASAGEGKQVVFEGYGLSGSAAANYEIEGQPPAVTATIRPRPLTVTADDLAISFGDEAPAYAASFDSFAPGEDVSVLGGTLSFACSYGRGDSAGRYEVVPSGLVTNGNYDVSFANGWLTVGPAQNEWVTQPAIDGWVLGQAASSPRAAAAFGVPTFMFAPRGTEAWSSELPRAAGDYVMRATVAGTDDWEALEATVDFSASYARATFDANSRLAWGTTPDVTGAVGDTPEAPTCGFTWEGHDFVGWNTERDGLGTSLAPGDPVELSAEPRTLYAQWDPVGELAYDGNGATSGATAPQPGHAGDEVLVADCGFARDGFDFLGWNTARDGGGRAYAPGDTLTLSAGGDLLYAQWAEHPQPAGRNAMYRLYNPYSGEHFYTASPLERDAVAAAGWSYEGVGWVAPAEEGEPVYRLYNAYAGDHHYTLSAGERDVLVAAGWNYEGVGWLSCPEDAQGAQPVWRQYNPYARTGAHNFTTSMGEHVALCEMGWRGEGVAWYGLG